ncbi:MAG: DUF4388 domain-containing protein [Coriobacteriales bacterium]
MALRGNLKDFSLPDVFQLVQLSRKTGVLRIRSASAEGSVWFRDGEVFFAQSNWHRDLLGQRLVSSGRLTPSALDKTLAIRRNEPPEGRRLGQILVDEGYISANVLEAFVQEQIQDTIFDLMRWDEGDFDFEVLPEVVDEDIGLSVSIENIVMEGSRRIEEWNRIRKKVPSMDMVFKMATAPGEGTFEISLKPSEWNLLLLVDGTRSVGELAADLGKTDFEVARIIYGLFSAGLLEVASDEEVTRLRAERAEREARRARVEEEEPEVPEFLSAPKAMPSADDMAVFEQMMEAVLHPVAGVQPSEPEVPSPVEPTAESEPVGEVLPAFDATALLEPEPEQAVGETREEIPAAGFGALYGVDVGEIPAPPVAEEQPGYPPSFDKGAYVPTGDLEADLLALGLGEAPPEGVAEEAAAQPPSLAEDLEVTHEPAEEEAPLEGPAAGADLDALLRSLSFEEEVSGTPSEEPATAGVISTDAYLAEFGTGMGLASGMGDEITALTGGGSSRTRPVTTVNKIPEAGAPHAIHRDQMVDRDLVQQIIEGIKKL